MITHRIGTDVCMARQRSFFHKCHRCIYRGQAAEWEPEAPPLPMLNVHAAEEPAHADVKEVPLARPAAAKGPAAKTPPAKAPSGKPAVVKPAAMKPAAMKLAADKPDVKPAAPKAKTKPKVAAKAPAAIEAASPVG